MNNLKENERRTLEQLHGLSEGNNELSLSLRQVDLRIKRKLWTSVTVERKASHVTVRNLLKSLEKKGYISIGQNQDGTTKINFIN